MKQPKDLKSYTYYKDASTPIRLYLSEKDRFDRLKHWLTDAAGRPFSQAQVCTFLLDCGEEKLEELLKGKTEENHA